MIRVLIVEDDKLVRKSFIQAFDWEKFGMSVVGDAKNGEKALQYLNTKEVDLIITDLAMPIMSGIELIKQVKEKYPNIFIVVLSLHQDFEYIQEAMRLGAIDYIAKVELDDEHMDATLHRIQNRIKAEKKKVHQVEAAPSINIRKGFLFLAEQQLDAYMEQLSDLMDQEIYDIAADAVFIPTDHKQRIEQEIEQIQAFDHSLFIFWVDNYESRETLKKQVLQYKDHFIFYETTRDHYIEMKDYKQLLIPQQRVELSEIEERLVSLQWVKDNMTLYALLEDVRQIRLPKHKINELILMTMYECRKIYEDLLPSDLALPASFSYWIDIENWFLQAKSVIHQNVFSQSFSNETNQSILQAVHIVEQELAQPITAGDVAERVYMSRSYFSICFKEIVGYTFHEYLRIARINKAKKYLKHTREKVAVIAEKVGYTDIKYFSKMFKQTTGCLPTEYRKRNRRVKDVLSK
ncbi:response regulator [Gracilibacillus sp. YIM 98692]|uniref:response regulator transcription factor n=1 Tax=Gracilibacillus sp. YIM 98692 TaxID=2663532 RepID=UPI0013D272DB|nr:response regulator [Gracilibacillus sp. YIM 98692]